MSLRAMLHRSVAVTKAEDVIRACETQTELENAWEDWASQYRDGSPEQRHLMAVYQARQKAIRDMMLAPFILRT